ncbi:hypothetical protein FDP22_12655 [Paroceanicella profunda]|uniref:Glycoside hydrolase family 104 protein n=1 Tax=Paroceanicella profunda TaxID=2579971 RepID=A0A5B8FI09_9RHOB|nr:hypothetical protein [Paroceanicella profunda]QDL92558.1 hypothetical protein FDP22_12655 [Paroceanicella profunda]
MTPQPILNLIARHESGGDYDIVFGGVPASARPGRPITTMTLRDVIAWQVAAVRAGSRSSAAGKYQIIRRTLEATYPRAGMVPTDLFDVAGQDRLGVQLLRGRGWDAWCAGALSDVSFADALSREWASLPVQFAQQGGSRWVERGQSYYAGDGLNKALTSPESVLEALKACREPVAVEPPAPEPAAPEPAQGPWAALISAIAKLFGGRNG